MMISDWIGGLYMNCYQNLLLRVIVEITRDMLSSWRTFIFSCSGTCTVNSVIMLYKNILVYICTCVQKSKFSNSSKFWGTDREAAKLRRGARSAPF